MAAFRDDPDELRRLDYQLLRFSPIVMYFDRRVLEEDVAWLVENRYIVDRLDAAEWRAESDALGAIARRLEFPAYFGGNLDALGDCLLDLQVPDESGRAVVFERYDALVARVGTFAWTVLDVFASKCRHHLLLGRRLIVMLQSDDPQLDLRPVGACPVAWNYQEWLNKSRRL